MDKSSDGTDTHPVQRITLLVEQVPHPVEQIVHLVEGIPVLLQRMTHLVEWMTHPVEQITHLAHSELLHQQFTLWDVVCIAFMWRATLSFS